MSWEISVISSRSGQAPRKTNLLAYWLHLFYFLEVISVHERRSAGLNQACCKQMLCKLPQTALPMTAILSYDIHCNCCSLGPFLGHSSVGFPKMGIFLWRVQNLEDQHSFPDQESLKPYLSHGLSVVQDRSVKVHYLSLYIWCDTVTEHISWCLVRAVSCSFLLFLLLKAKRMRFPITIHKTPCSFLIKILL